MQAVHTYTTYLYYMCIGVSVTENSGSGGEYTDIRKRINKREMDNMYISIPICVYNNLFFYFGKKKTAVPRPAWCAESCILLLFYVVAGIIRCHCSGYSIARHDSHQSDAIGMMGWEVHWMLCVQKATAAATAGWVCVCVVGRRILLTAMTTTTPGENGDFRAVNCRWMVSMRAAASWLTKATVSAAAAYDVLTEIARAERRWARNGLDGMRWGVCVCDVMCHIHSFLPISRNGDGKMCCCWAVAQLGCVCVARRILMHRPAQTNWLGATTDSRLLPLCYFSFLFFLSFFFSFTAKSQSGH